MLLNPPAFCRLSFKEFQQDSWCGKEKVTEEVRVCKTGSTDRQQRKILVVCAGMGSGKSRVLTELHNIIQPELDGGSILIELRVDFENATRRQEHERSTNNRASVVEKAVLDRIMSHLMRDRERECFGYFFCKERKWGFNLTGLVTAIQRHLETVEKKKVFVLVTVNGGQSMDRECGMYSDEGIYDEDDRQRWYRDSAVRALFVVLHDTMMNVPRVMCAVSSSVTLPYQGISHSESQTMRKAFIDPPPLTKLPDEIKNTTALKHAEHFVGLLGKHPRTMEFLLDTKETDMKAIMDHCADDLHERYQYNHLRADALNDLLRYSLSTCSIASAVRSPVGRVVDDFQFLGLTTLTDKTLRISPLLMYALKTGRRAPGQISSDEEFPILDDWQPFTNDTCAQEFERLIGYVQCVRSKVFTGEVPLDEFLHGVRWVTDLPSSMQVKPAPLTLEKAKHKLHTDSKSNGETLSRGIKSKNKKGEEGFFEVEDTYWSHDEKRILKGHCVMNADHASAGDLFFPLDQSTASGTKPIHVVTQALHSESGIGDDTLSDKEVKEVKKNAETAAAEGDVYLLVTKKHVNNDTVLSGAVKSGAHVGVVDATNFDAHFGPFSLKFFPPSSLLSSRPVWPALQGSSSLLTDDSESEGLQPLKKRRVEGEGCGGLAIE